MKILNSCTTSKKKSSHSVIHADFECLTVPRHKIPYNETNIDIYGAKPPRSQFKTEIYQLHTPCGFMMNAVNSIENTSEQYLHRGEEGMDNFCLKLNEIRAKIEEMMKYNEPIDMSAGDERHLKKPLIAVSAVISLNQLLRIKR